MAGTLILLYALQSIFGCIPQSIFLVAWVLFAMKILVYMIEHTHVWKEDENNEKQS